MTLLQQALEALEVTRGLIDADDLFRLEVMKSLRTAIAQAEQPVKYEARFFLNGITGSWVECSESEYNILLTEKTTQVRALYTHPQAVKPLSGEQLRDIARTFKANTKWRLEEHWDEIVSFVREVEAAHNIKEQQP